MYLIGYGLGRFWIEGLRTDQLQIGSTGLAVSQLLSAVLVLVGTAVMIVMLRRKKLMEQATEALAGAVREAIKSRESPRKRGGRERKLTESIRRAVL